MEMSFFPEPARSRMARDREATSPTILAVTGERRLLTGSETGTPHARLMQATRASCM